MSDDYLLMAFKKTPFIYKDTSNNREAKAYNQVCDALKIDKNSFGSIKVKVAVYGWNSLYRIHSWFVNNIQNGVDDGQNHYITREQLQKYVNTCKKALANKKKAHLIFPIKADFRNREQANMDDYFRVFEHDIKCITRVLKNPKFKDWDFCYTG
jgi:hypothetical protein